MSLLKSHRLTGRRKNILLLIASLLLAVPCIAATPFALSFEINQQEPTVFGQSREQDEQQKQERLRAEMLERVQQLKDQERLTPAARAELAVRLREVERLLEEHEKLAQRQEQDPRARAAVEARLKRVQQNLEEHQRLLQKYQQQQGSDYEKAGEAYKRLSELLAKYRESSQLYAQNYVEAQKLLEQQYRETRKPRVINRVEPVYPADARDKNIKGSVVLTMVVDREGNPQDIKIWKSLYPSMDQAAIEAARQMRFEPALKDGQTVSETLLVEFYFSTQNKHVEVMGYGEGKGAGYVSGQGTGGGVGYASGQGTGGGAGYESAVRDMRIRKEREASVQDERVRRQAELAQGAVISMDRAIQIAISKYPGKVLACSLGRDKEGPVFYHVVIIVTEGDKTTTKYVWVSAVDGTIIKTEDERKASSISAGTLNGKAISLPQATYPEIARAARAQGEVVVDVTVDEQGNVADARASGGHPLLQSAAVNAARQAKFSPTYLQGVPVTVKGQLLYNFVIQ